MVKRWLLVIRCSTTGAIHLEMIDYMDTSSFLLPIEIFLALRPRPSVFIADNGSNFKGGDSALQGITEKGQINLAKAQSHFNIKFQFAPPRAPHFQGLVERFVWAAKVAIHSAVHAHTLTDQELRTISSRAMGHLNNVPIAYTVKSEADFHYLPLTLGHFLMGLEFAELQPIDTENTKLTNATRYIRVCSVLELFWKRLVAELTSHLRVYNNCISKTRGVKINDIAFLCRCATTHRARCADGSRRNRIGAG
jgi:hypothetical protein